MSGLSSLFSLPYKLTIFLPTNLLSADPNFKPFKTKIFRERLTKEGVSVTIPEGVFLLSLCTCFGNSSRRTPLPYESNRPTKEDPITVFLLTPTGHKSKLPLNWDNGVSMVLNRFEEDESKTKKGVTTTTSVTKRCALYKWQGRCVFQGGGEVVMSSNVDFERMDLVAKIQQSFV